MQWLHDRLQLTDWVKFYISLDTKYVRFFAANLLANIEIQEYHLDLLHVYLDDPQKNIWWTLSLCKACLELMRVFFATLT